MEYIELKKVAWWRFLYFCWHVIAVVEVATEKALEIIDIKRSQCGEEVR